MIEKQVLQAIEPVLDEIVELHQKIASIELTPGEKGEPGVGVKSASQTDDGTFTIEFTDGQALAVKMPDGRKGTGIKSIGKSESNTIVIELDDSQVIEIGLPDGQIGPQGDKGIGIKGVSQGEDKSLVIELDNDQSFSFPIPAGEQGATGAGIKSISQTDSKSISILLDNDESFTVALPAGERGMDGIGIKSIEQPDPSIVLFEFDNNEKVEVKLPCNKGETGESGAGIETALWEVNKVYREGAIVCHHLGQYFKALKDTHLDPDSEDWVRLGSGGLRFCKSYAPDAEYRTGDLYVKDYGLFGVFDGEHRIIAGRGAKGDRGEKGMPGRDGKDAADIIAFETDGLKAVLVMQDQNGDINHRSIDFTDAVKKEIHDHQKDASGNLDIDDVIAAIGAYSSHLSDADAIPVKFYRGLWEASAKYELGDSVTFDASLYLATATSQGEIPAGAIVKPGSSSWQIIVMGSSLGGSGGGGGDGTPGAPGLSAYEIAVQNGFVGTEQEWLDSLQGEQGIGLRYVDRVPSQSDLAAIANPEHGDIYVADDTGIAYIWNSVSGTWDDAGPIVGAPGVDGTAGLSAYEIAVAEGFVGTEAEWIASLQGADGVAGSSAYEVAVENGFVGTEQEWLDSLQGADGPTAVSLDPDNAAVISPNDGLIFVPMQKASIYSGEVPPADPKPDDLWFKTSTAGLYVFYDDGTSSQWVQTSSAPGSATMFTGELPPTNPTKDQLWFNSQTASMFAFYVDSNGGQWVEIVSIGASPEIKQLQDQISDLKKQVADLFALIQK
jgi:hypothetical protein